ncbi:AMIN-like domain-containing (lipo)protein [Corynebacterium uterequi]|uniref:AMIN-like domain-containing protein n=1 Tax=Corynebacterium uterequi TaxID=1072256 RepID=A0A0G3HJL6_9CORY|nr:hypothetical protein [Corynebacterium uterequi]AKK11317.1 hypothetical protein CUTER_06640 [Corynebacterium uterequi]
MTQRPLLPRSARKLSIAALSAASALLLAACTHGADAPVAPRTTTMTASPQASAPDEHSGTTSAGANATTEPSEASLNAGAEKRDKKDKAQAPEGAWNLAITDVRVGEHSDFDRVVVEFLGEGTPGWNAAYAKQAHQQGSGFPVELAGDSYLQVMIEGVGISIDHGHPDFEVGPVEDSAVGHIAEVYHGGVFEGQSQLVIGLEGRARAYSVTTLENPTRLVIDISN